MIQDKREKRWTTKDNK